MVRERKTQKNHDHLVSLTLMMMMMMVAIGAENGTREIQVGVIFDMDSYSGKSNKVCISMALEDFYRDNNQSNVIIRPHYRDSESNDIQAASAAIDLLKNTQVMAILGPQQSSQANFILDIAEKSKVPLISSATSPDLSPIANNFLIRTAHTSSTQAQPIVAIIKSFGWREIVFVYEDSDFGRGLFPYLSDAMETIDTHVNHCILLPPSSSDDFIIQQLNNSKTMQTRVFVVHMLPALASRFFKKADGAGMMTRGYAWIITDVLTIHLINHLVPQDGKFMHGVIGVKPYIPPSKKLTHFHKRWRRRFHKEYPEEMDRIFEVDMFGIWWYDFVFALATSLQKVKTELISSTTFKRPTSKGSTTDLTAIGTSEMGGNLISIIRNVKLKGPLSGDFEVINGQLQILAYEIVNFIGRNEKRIGFWNSKNGITSRYNESMKGYTTNKDDFGGIIWPGDTVEIPKGWEITTNDKKLRVGVPAKGGFAEFISAERDSKTNMTNASGFCIDVFKAVVDVLPYAIDYKFIAFDTSDAQRSGDYNDLVHQIVLQQYDMVVGDVTIRWNRSLYVDFTTPYSESGVSMIVPVKDADKKNAWIFMKPFEMKLWITTGAFFIYTGFVVWALEHRVNHEFRGPRYQQIAIIFWFSFSTLVFSHKEKMISNLSRFVVIVWVFVVLVLTSSYTASLSSMLTLQSFEPTVTSIDELIARGDYIGYQDGSFVADMLKDMGISEGKLKKYTNITGYANALSSGSKNNGVSAIVDELPYLKMLQAKDYNKYSIVGETYNTAGFGFAFPKGSPMVVDFSKAILKLIEEDIMRNISNRWIGDEVQLSKKNNHVEPFDKLKLDSFIGLFVIAGFSSTCALVIFLFTFMNENKEILMSQGSIYQKLVAIIRSFDEEKYQKSSKNSTTETVDDSHMCIEDHTADSLPHSPITVDHQAEGVFSPGSSPIQ